MLQFQKPEEFKECTSFENTVSEDARRLDVDVHSALEKACRVFGVSKLFPQQKNVIKAFISKKDVLVNLLTGFGKSLTFQIALVVHVELSKVSNTFAAKPVAIVISPSVNLIEDQKNFSRSKSDVDESRVRDTSDLDRLRII
ncbi:probable ATP-dependent RNA helicase ddx55 [Montipora foliosa]|uniref:probable ATP-dependent RNA helicase ddx55 n=1 Tax=Montipora foliosa TaxID=591990 RepID=UPI0035F1FE75